MKGDPSIMDILQEIYQTVDNIVQRRMEQSGLNNQIQAIVLGSTNGKYIISVNGAKYSVRDGVGINPQPNTPVWVCVPSNDWNKAYICAGKCISGGGSGNVDDVYQNGNSVLGEDHIARIRCATPEDIQQLQANFQDGVEAIGNACTRKGSTPASSSLEDTVAAIDAIQTGGNYMTKEITEDGTYSASDDDVDAYDKVIVAVRGGLRPHTVVFLDKDETTVLETVRDVPWGGGATYHGAAPTSSGMRFVGWSPNPTYVTEDLWCRPRFENISYSSDQILDDWVTIACHCQQNPDYYPTGKWKVLELQDGTLIKMQLVAKAVDPLEGGNGYANTTWVAMTVFDISFNPSGYGCGYYGTPDWENDALRAYLQTTFLQNKFPQELVPYLKTVIKYTSGYNMDSGALRSDYPTIENIWIPSRKEVLNGSENLGTFYDVAFGVDGQPNQNARKRPYYNGNYNIEYQLRTGKQYGYYYNQRQSYRIVCSSGAESVMTPTNSAIELPYVIGFCL